MDHSPENIAIADFDYDLPLERIAQYPLKERDQSRVLLYKDGDINQGQFKNLAQYLPGESLMIFNETRVVHARLLFRKKGGSAVEVFCLEPGGEFPDYQVAYHQKESSQWACLIGNSRRWKSSALELTHENPKGNIILRAERIAQTGAISSVRFSWTPSGLCFSEILETFGKVPLPPYINRPATEIDDDHYQTVYARQDGSVAAPTAGLHFTPQVLHSLEEKGMDRIYFTLHVGAGTFRPVVTEQIGAHEMHAEQVHLDLAGLKKLHNSLEKPIILVGTTSARLMESLYWHGVQLITGRTEGHHMDIQQWDPYKIGENHGIDRKQSLEKVIESLEKSGKQELQGRTRLIITPGYKYRYPDVLITNFHQPKSTLLLLVAAFIGEDWKKAYRFALDNEFRFLSYGDSCILFNRL